MKIQHLCKSFDGKVVLDHVSLTLESGGTACLMAPSGRGKTTLLRCIAGLEDPDSGQITDQMCIRDRGVYCPHQHQAE